MKKAWNPMTWVEFAHTRRSRVSKIQPTPDRRQPVASSSRPPSSTDRMTSASRIRPTGQVAVILPVYNEQACIQRTIAAVLNYLPEHPNYNFIFVDDGSSDRTKYLISEAIHVAKTRQIQLLSYSPRAGKGFAIRRGIDYADSDLICFLDGDLAYSLDHLDLLVEKLQKADVVIGCRSLAMGNDKELKFSRKMAGKIFNFLSRKILDLDYSDMQAGLKGFRKDAAKTLFQAQQLTGFSFDVELIYLAEKWGYSIGEIPAKVSNKHLVKVSKVNLLQDSIRMLIDLLKIRLNDRMGLYR